MQRESSVAGSTFLADHATVCVPACRRVNTLAWRREPMQGEGRRRAFDQWWVAERDRTALDEAFSGYHRRRVSWRLPLAAGHGRSRTELFSALMPSWRRVTFNASCPCMPGPRKTLASTGDRRCGRRGKHDGVAT
jgi:hypothetical protein